MIISKRNAWIAGSVIFLGFVFLAVRSDYFYYVFGPKIPNYLSDILFWEPEETVSYNIVSNSPTYKEYEFDGKVNPDSGSRDLLWQLRRDKKTLHGDAMAFTENEMDYAELTEADEQKGIIQKYNGYHDIKRLRSIGVYELRSDAPGTSYSLYQNGNLLFERKMEYGADGPILDWRIVDGKPAFTIRLSCPVVDSVQTCTNDVFYNGEFMNEKYDISDSRYLFAYDGKIGFVAKDNGKDRIFFNGSFITPGFDTIHTHNCCSIQQVLPTVYSNGVLLFYGSRGGKDRLAEVKLGSESLNTTTRTSIDEKWSLYTSRALGVSVRVPKKVLGVASCRMENGKFIFAPGMIPVKIFEDLDTIYVGPEYFYEESGPFADKTECVKNVFDPITTLKELSPLSSYIPYLGLKISVYSNMKTDNEIDRFIKERVDSTCKIEERRPEYNSDNTDYIILGDDPLVVSRFACPTYMQSYQFLHDRESGKIIWSPGETGELFGGTGKLKDEFGNDISSDISSSVEFLINN